jgi:hypothetical protein
VVKHSGAEHAAVNAQHSSGLAKWAHPMMLLVHKPQAEHTSRGRGDQPGRGALLRKGTGKLNSVRWWIPSTFLRSSYGYPRGLFPNTYAAMVRLWVPLRPLVGTVSP